VLRVVEDSKAFSVEAEYDGDFWFVKICAHEDGNVRHRFTYKINHPKNEEAETTSIEGVGFGTDTGRR
jgi:hypothetical protein